MAVFVLFLFGFAVVIVIFLHFRKKDKKRSDDFAQLALYLGMSFSKKVDSTFRKKLKGFKRFHGRPNNLNRYRNDKFRNKLSENRKGLELVFFECTPSHNHNGMGAMDGVFYFQSDSINLPRFELSPMDQAPQLFLNAIGISHMNFDSHPQFSKHYILAGGDESALRELFNKSVLDYFEEQNDKFYIQGYDNKLILYRSADQDPFSNTQPKSRVEPEEFKVLKEQATTICKLFF